MMKMVGVQSSNIDKVGHEGTTLEIHFKNGGRYRYFDVPATEHAKLMAAESLGSHFHAHIRRRDPAYRYQKIGD